MKGTISISHNGHIVQQLLFTSEWNRSRIIEKWKRLYGKGFKNAEVSEVIEGIEEPEQSYKPEKSTFKKGFKAKTYSFKKRNTKSADSRL